MRVLRNAGIGLGILLLTLLLLLVATHEGRVAVRTALLVPEILPNASWRPLLSLSEPSLVEDVSYDFVGGQSSGTVYRPNDGNRHGAVILFLGVNPDLEDATLRRLSESLAREGVVVLLPHPVSLGEGRVTYQEVENLIGAFRFLRDAPYVDPRRVGYGGFCVGSSLALIAAADARISSDVRFVNFFGGYYSVADLLAAMTTRRVGPPGAVQRWEPNEDALSWFSEQVTGAVTDLRERAILEQALRAAGRTAGAAPVDGPSAAEELSPRAQAIYSVLSNRDVSRAPALYAGLPEDLRARFERLSPSTTLDWLQARVLVMHDRNDTYVPFTESERLIAALEDYPRKHYTSFDIFQHMHPQRELPPWQFAREIAKLFYHLYLVMLEIA